MYTYHAIIGDGRSSIAENGPHDTPLDAVRYAVSVMGRSLPEILNDARSSERESFKPGLAVDYSVEQYDTETEETSGEYRLTGGLNPEARAKAMVTDDGPLLRAGAFMTGKEVGHNLDPVDVNAGVREAALIGYGSPTEVMVIGHALNLWRRGEEETCKKVMRRDAKVDETSLTRILAAALAAGAAAFAASTAA